MLIINQEIGVGLLITILLCPFFELVLELD